MILETYQGGILVVHTDEENFRTDLGKHDKKFKSCSYLFIHASHWEANLYRCFKRPLDSNERFRQLGITIDKSVWVTMNPGDFIALAMSLSEDEE